jgi:hypothetical protein
LEKEQPNPSLLINKLPEELRANYESSSRRCSVVVECLKVAAALKLWVDRGYRQLGFGVESEDGGKSFYVDVLANGDNGMVGVECASSLHLGWLRWQVKKLRRYLPPNSYIIIVFPENVGEQAEKAVELADEVWVTGKDGTVEQMMFMSVFRKR